MGDSRDEMLFVRGCLGVGVRCGWGTCKVGAMATRVVSEPDKGNREPQRNPFPSSRSLAFCNL